MKEQNVIEVQNVTKKFRVFQDRGRTLKELTLFKNRRTYEERTVLNDISFEVRKGEAIGLIGQNGCGKSTTLKLLTKIMYPDEGTIEMNGRVSSLLELGAGFHPDMSGRQNIYINASIFGLTKKEIDRRISDIIAFSELADFIDNPVRTYSSGMYMRLAFAVAINVDADILLIDEILAVGDANFQAKCFEKLHSIKKAGTTIVIVSHSMGQIEQICDRSIWIENGTIFKEGETKKVNEEYLFSMEQKRILNIRKDIIVPKPSKGMIDQAEVINDKKDKEGNDKWSKLRDKVPIFADTSAIRMGTGEIEFTDVKMFDAEMQPQTLFKTGEKIIIKMNYHSYIPGKPGNFGFGIFREDGVHCYGTNIELETDQRITTQKDGIVTVFIDKCMLLPSKYYLDVAIHGDCGYYYDDIRSTLIFYITPSSKRDIGVTRLETKWTCE